MGKRKRVEVEVVEASADPATVAPFVGYFAAGRSEIKSESVQEFSVLRDLKRPANNLLYASLDGVEFKGAPHGGDDYGQLPCSYALAVYNKKTGKLQVAPVSGGRIRRLEAHPTSLDYAPKQGAADVDESAEARRARNKRLVASFGSTRRVRQLQSYEAGIVHSSRVSGAKAVEESIVQMAQAAQEAGYTREKVMQQASTASRVLPPHHPEATTGEEAYKLHEIVPNPIWKELRFRKLVEICKDSPEAREQLQDVIAKHKEPAYVISRLSLLKERKLTADGEGTEPTPAAKKAAKLLAFLSALLRVYQSGRKRLEMDEKGWPGLANKLQLRNGYDQLAEPMLNLFYNKSGDGTQHVTYELPQARQALMLRYILVTALLLEKCQMQPDQFEALRTELKMEAGDIAAQFKELGATTSVAKYTRPAATGQLTTPERPTRSFVVSLLIQQPGSEPKTLQQCFPELKVRSRSKK